MQGVGSPQTETKKPSYRTVGEGFDPRRNSLNFLRLFLACSVIASHTVSIGYGGRNIFGATADFAVYNLTSLGTVAVYGFFGISGFLIAGSASRNGFGRYLWQRFLRILPGFWVAIIITAFFFSVLGWASHSGYAAGIGLHRFLLGPRGALSFVTHNALLKMNQPLIYGGLWNASLWTLFYEFLCYLLLGALVLTGLIRRRAFVAALAVTFWAATFLITWTPGLKRHFAHGVNNSSYILGQMYFIRFGAIFLVGAVVYFYRDRIPDSGWLALGCFGIFVGGLYISSHGIQPDFNFTNSDLLVPLFAYPMIWLGLHLPLQKMGAKNDYSYGMYIYAFPVQTLLVVWGAWRWGYAAFLSLTLLGTIPFALASWWLIEKRALSLKKFNWTGVWGRLVGTSQAAADVTPSKQPEEA